MKVLVYGVEGIGKSTFGAAAPDCLILSPEDGTNKIPAFGRLSPSTWGEMIGLLEDLARDQHHYKSVAIDTLDWLEPLCWRHVADAAGKESIEAFGFGKGYTAALDAWRIFLARLQALQAKRMNVILVAHSIVKSFKNPDADVGDYDRYQLKLHDKASGLIKEWADFVLFANHELASVAVDPKKPEGPKKGVTSKKHVLYCRRTAAFDAKSRLWIDSGIQFSWSDFYAATQAAEDLQARFETAVAGLDAETREGIRRDMAKHSYEPKFVESIIAWAASAAPAPAVKAPAPTAAIVAAPASK